MRSAFTILYTDDYEDDIFLLQQAFKKANFNAMLQTARDGLEAVAYIKGEGEFADREIYPFPDFLLLDLNTPQMNGFEVLEWLRSQPQLRRLVVHVLSASSREADVDRAYELGANSYIVKPSRVGDLVALVRGIQQWHHFLAFPRVHAKCEPLRPSPAFCKYAEV